MKTNEAQTEWLKSKNLSLVVDPRDGTIDVRPVGVSIWDGPFYSIRQWAGEGAFEIMYHWVDGKFGTDDPCARTVYKFASLKEALRELLACKVAGR